MGRNPPDRSLDLLAGRVFDIPEPQFIDLVHSLEARRLRLDQRATADAVLSRLRPRMATAKPPRRPTPQRLFCLPFEDLLYDPGTTRKAVGRIPRSAIVPVWALFASEARPGVIETASAALKSADPDDSGAVLAAGLPLWSEGNRVFRERDARARKSAQGRAELRDELGGEPILASLDDITIALGIARPILELRAGLPPAPIEAIDDDGLQVLIKALRTVAVINREGITHIIFVLMARLRDLGMLSTLFEMLHDAGAGDLAIAIGGQAREAVVSQTEDRLIDVRTELQDAELPKTAVAKALGREIEILGRATNAISDADGTSGRELNKRIERVKTELTRVAREVVVSGSSEATLKAIDDLNEIAATDEEEIQRLRAVEDRIIALRLCKQFSEDPETVALLAQSMKSIGDGLDARGKEIVGKLEEDDPDVSVVDLYNTVRLVELVDGSDKANRLRIAGVKAMQGG